MVNEISNEDVAFVALLKACAKKKNICKGMEIHDELLKRGLLHKNLYISSSVISMYAKCGFLEKARKVIENLPFRNVVTWNALISGYSQEEEKSQEALNCFKCMLIEGAFPNSVTFICVLKACGNIGAIDEGEHIHEEITRRGLLEKDGMMLGASLVNMYAKCGVLGKAKEVLEELPTRTLASWNALISGYAQQGQGHKALACFERMQSEDEGIIPDVVTFISILKACGNTGNIQKGIHIHDEIVGQGLLEKNVRIGSALVDMYAKCGMLAKSQQVLEELPIRNEVSWSSLIAGYAQQCRGYEAFKCFERMRYEGYLVDAITFICILKACDTIGAIDKGKEIHNETVYRGLINTNIVLGTALVDMYARCGLFTEAQYVLDVLPIRNEVSWSALIEGYTHNREDHEALNCLEQMRAEGISPNAITFISILKACGNTGAINEGIKIHDEIETRRDLLEKDIVLGTALVDMYVKCEMLAKAKLVLQGLPIRNVVCWNALITGYTEHGHGHEALKSLERMQIEGFSPDSVTFLSIMKACGRIGALDKGKHFHHEILNRGFLGKDVMLCNALVDMYAKCGMLAQAQKVLEECPIRDVVTWNTLIQGYAEYGQCYKVLNCFERMQSEGLSPNTTTLIYILKACGSAEAIGKGKEIHGEIADMALVDNDMVVFGNASMDMYAKFGMFGTAKEVLEKFVFRDVIAWNALITTYVQHGQGHKALDSFEQMQSMGISPDMVTFICILKACGSTGALDKGKQIHHDISSKGFLEKDIMLGTALVDMYVKCGCLVKAQEVLEELPVRNVVTWNALIAGYAQQEQLGISATLTNIEHMKIEGLAPNEVTFICVLNACGRWGQLCEAERLFENMVRKYGISPNIEHYISMVQTFGNAGLFDKAVSIIKMMPFSYYPTIGLALLHACSKWGNLEVGKLSFNQAIPLDYS